MCKVIEMRKSQTQIAQLWSDLFNSFCRDIDKVAAHQKEQQVSCPQPTKAVNHEGGTGAVANRKPSTEHANGGAAQSFSAPFQSYRQAQEVVNLDDLGIQIHAKEIL